MEFKLRRWVESDAEAFAKYANNQTRADNMMDSFPYPYTEEHAKNFITSCTNDDESRKICRAIEVNKEAVGSIGIFLKDDVYRRSASIAYWLGEPFWGKGIISNAITKMSDYAFQNYDIVRISAEPFAYNIGSRKALEKAGFILEGIMKNSVYKNGKLYDSCMYAKLKD
jgi:ribosomal-protein-alanine N-acetyltransferase